MLRALGRDVLEFGEGLGNVSWHGEVDCSGGVVPGQGDSAVEDTTPISGDGIE